MWGQRKLAVAAVLTLISGSGVLLFGTAAALTPSMAPGMLGAAVAAPAAQVPDARPVSC